MTDLVEQHKDEVHTIALEIDRLIAENPQVKSRFTKQIEHFCKMFTGDLTQKIRLSRQVLYRQGAINKDEIRLCDYVLLAIVHECMMGTPAARLFSTAIGSGRPDQLDTFYNEVCEIFCCEKHAIFTMGTVGVKPTAREIRNLKGRKSQIDLARDNVLLNLRAEGLLKDDEQQADEQKKDAGTTKLPEQNSSENIFKKDGDIWFVRFNSIPEKPLPIKDSSGMAYIAKLLASDKPISATEFTCSIVDMNLRNKSKNLLTHDTDDNFGAELTTGAAEPLADDEALQKARQRLIEIPAEIDEAKKIFDNAAVERLEKERDDIQTYLDQTLRPGSSKVKTFQNEAKKTAQRVNVAIDRAITYIKGKKELKLLGIHLKQTIKKTGIDFSYTPDQKKNWEL